MVSTSLLLIPFVFIIFVCAILAVWWLIRKARSTSSVQGELKLPATWTQTRALWSSGALAGLTSIAGLVIAGLTIVGIISILPTSQDPGFASGIGLAIGVPLFCFGGIWIIASSVFGVWLHRRFAGNTSITIGLLIGLINGGVVGVASIIFSSFFGALSISNMVYIIITSVFDILILLFPSIIGGILGGVLFQKNTEKATL